LDRSPRYRRTRVLSLCVASGLVAWLTLGFATSTDAARPCSVKNQDTGIRYQSDLQAAIDAASPGATLRINGRCVGVFAISADLTLVGASRRGSPTVTLDANGFGPGLIVDHATVTLTDLRITGASAVSGIENVGGDLTLNGSSIVTGNSSGNGAGIYNIRGNVTLTDTSSVSGNTATVSGGGIFNEGDPLSGGLSAWLFLFGSSTVSGNSAGADGGGIYNLYGTVEMFDASTGTHMSTVSGNTADGTGGGVFNDGNLLDVIAFPNSDYNVFGNDPDDVYP
jgi:hypothetical protein